MSDIHALSGAYAVDALDEFEVVRFERHLADCSVCRAEVDSLREAGAMLAETAPVVPSAGLRDRVLADIATVRPLPPLVPEVTHLGSRRRWFPTLVAAAAVVGALGVGGTIWHPWSDDASRSVSADGPVARIVNAPDAQSFVQVLPDGSEARIVRSKSLNGAVVITKDMAPPPAGKVYELWFQDPQDGMVPAGLMKAGENTLVLTGDAVDAIGAGITVEPASGSRVPTSDPVALFSFEQT